MANIFITGSAGFIGFHLSQLFLKHSHKVFGVDNMYPDENFEMKKLRLEILSQDKNYTHFSLSLDISHRELYEILIADKPDIIIHLAAKTGVRESENMADYYFDANILATKNVFDSASKLTIPVIYASSSSVYGTTKEIYLKEDQVINTPLSIYGITKIAAENLGYYYSNKYKMNIVGLRFFTVYGPYSRMDMACWKFINKIYYQVPLEVFGQGKLKRDFTYIDDITWGIYQLYQKMISGHIFKNEKFNFGYGQGREVNELIKIIENKISRKANVHYLDKLHEDMYETLADNHKAAVHLGFQPKTGLEEGVEHTVNWYLSRR